MLTFFLHPAILCDYIENPQRRGRTMKRTAQIVLILMLIASIPLQAQDPANDEYIKAMTATDAGQRIQLLKEWLNKYGGSGHQYENFANATICTTQYTGKTAADIIKYGEKALSIGGLDDSTKAQVLVNLASVYLQQNPSKAETYATQLIQTATAAKAQKANEGSEQVWDQLTGAGHFIQGQALEKERNLKGALDAYLKSYNILKTKEIATVMAQLGKSLYEAQDYASAEKAFRSAVPVLGDFGSITLYAKTLHRLDRKADALKFYKQSYQKRKTGEVAFNIGILMAPDAQNNAQAAMEAIQYLLDASFLSQANSQKAMQMAEGLYFLHHPEYNQKVQALQAKGKELEQLTNTFNSKFGDKTEEDLSEAEQREMKSLLAEIEAAQAAVQQLQSEQQAALEKFNLLVEQTKQRLGVK
jgi:hypothetical protein